MRCFSRKQKNVLNASFSGKIIIQSDFIISFSRVIPNFINIQVSESNGDYNLIFRGYVKNKSELQKLLIQLVIKQ
mgnify:CR=1 FL=1